MNNIYANQTLNAILLNQFEEQIILPDGKINPYLTQSSFEYLYRSCSDNIQKYSDYFVQFSSNVYNDVLDNMKINVFPNRQYFVEKSQNKLVVFFINRIKEQLELGYVETIFFNQQNIILLCLSSDQTSGQLEYESMQYLISNYYNNSIFAQDYTSKLLDRIKDSQSVFHQLYIYFGSIIGCTFFTMFVIFIHYFKLINQYKSKVLLLLARINVEEVEQEINKLNECQKLLDDHYEIWITSSFYQILSKQIKKQVDNKIVPNSPSNKKKQIKSAVKANIKVSEQGNNSQQASPNSKLFKLKGIFNNLKEKMNINKIMGFITKKDKPIVKSGTTNKSGSQKQLSSLIQNHQLSIVRQVLIISFFCITGSIFFFAILITNYSKTSEIEPLNDLYFQSIQNTQSLCNVITFGYLLISNKISSFNHPTYPLILSKETKEYFNQQLHQIQMSINQLANALTSSSAFNSQSLNESDKIMQIFEEDLCQLSKEFISCADENSPFRQVIQNGLSGIITSYSQLYFQNSYLSNSEITLTQDQVIQEFHYFISNPSFKNLIVLGYDLPMFYMMNINELINKAITNQTKYIRSFVFAYFFSVGLIIGLMWLLFSIKTRRKFNDELRSINFSLTLLPYHKCQEEATIYILKSIQKI